jgi:uncharacterized protein YvpB
MKWKGAIFTFFVCTLISGWSGGTNHANADTITTIDLYIGSNQVMINDTVQQMDSTNPNIVPVLDNGRTLVPIRFLASIFGGTITWHAENQSVSILLKDQEFHFTIDSKLVLYNGVPYQMDAAAKLLQNRTYIPIRTICNLLGKQIQYQNGLVEITDAQSISPPDHIAMKVRSLTSAFPYQVYQYDQNLRGFPNLNDAISYAQHYDHSSVQTKDGSWLWDSYLPYRVYQNQKFIHEFDTFVDAVNYAKDYANSWIAMHKYKIWDREKEMKSSRTITNVPKINQLPELPRGCEVTALAMLLQYAGVDVDKMTLASQIKKVPFRSNGYYGDPNDGFVGDMYDFSNPGYGVYHGPIAELASKYLPNQVIDLTGASFHDILYQVSEGRPVWVIENIQHDAVSDAYWETWKTRHGTISITRKEHAVVITGYDANYVYLNDPLNRVNKVSRNAFERAWNQMGNQAITIATE